jgi:hypothetical protein
VISIAGISAVAFLAVVRSAIPGAVPVRVVWDAPSGCSDAESFFAAVASRAERIRRAEPGEEGARLEVKLTRLGPKVHGELRLGSDDSELRKVDGATCDEVAEALSLTAALALSASARVPGGAAGGPGLTGSSTPAQAAPAPPPSAAPAPPAAPTVAPSPPAASAPVAPAPASVPAPFQGPAPALASPGAAPASRPAPSRRSFASWLALGLGPAAGQVVAPHLSVGGTAQLRVAPPSQDHLASSAALAFLYLRNDLLGRGGEPVFRLAAATVTGCPGWGWRGSIASVELCATGLGGWLLASDTGVTVSRSVSRSWWSAGAVLRARAEVGAGFVLQLDASASVPLVKRRFVTTTPEQTVGTSPAVAPLLGLTLAHGL